MLQPKPPITGFAVRLTTSYVGDAAETTLVTVVHFDVSVPYAEVHAVTPTGESRLVGRSPTTIGKVDSASAEAFPNGTVRLWVSAADPHGGSGSTSFIQYFDFPNAVPAVARDAEGASRRRRTARSKNA
jgi:hypothetical protein